MDLRPQKSKRYFGGLKQMHKDDVDFYKQRQLEQYLDDTKKNLEIVHYSVYPQSRSHFKQHTFDVYFDEPPNVRTSQPRQQTQISTREREQMEREITLFSIQLNENASRKSSRRTVRTRSSKRRGEGTGEGKNTPASSFCGPAVEQVPTQEKLNMRLNQRKAERGQGDMWRTPTLKDLTGIWGSRRLFLQKLSEMYSSQDATGPSLDSRGRAMRQGIASAPPKVLGRENTFTAVTPHNKPPATAAARPLTNKSTFAPPRSRLVVLRDPTLNKTPAATKLTLEDIALPSSPVRKERKGKGVSYSNLQSTVIPLSTNPSYAMTETSSDSYTVTT